MIFFLESERSDTVVMKEAAHSIFDIAQNKKKMTAALPQAVRSPTVAASTPPPAVVNNLEG